MAADYKWKVVMLGDFAVGKTSLVKRFVYDEFSDSYLTTIGVKVTRKDVLINNFVKADLLLWDIAGSDKFIKFTPEYVKGAFAGIIVGDVTRKSSIDNILFHIELLLNVNPEALVFIALNKSDLVERTEEYISITSDKLKGIAYKSITPTSAKDGNNVNVLFQNISMSILQGISNE
jgi:small GTP-binding protein